MSFTFVLLKPDCLRKLVVGAVIACFEDFKISIAASKVMTMHWNLCRDLYPDAVDNRPLEDFLLSGPVMPLILKADHSKLVEQANLIAGDPDPKKASKKTIRNVFGTDIIQNIIHVSNDRNSVERECQLFFKSWEIPVK